MKTKPVTPYARLLIRFHSYINSCLYRKTIPMWHYKKDTLEDGWSLDKLYERVAAAEQLGYDVRLRATDEGLVVEYIEKTPKRPFGM